MKKSILENYPELLTRKQTAELLQINLSTLWNYTRKGLIPSKGLGNRVYYLKEDVLKALQPLQ